MIPDDPVIGHQYGHVEVGGHMYAVVADGAHPVATLVVRGADASGSVVAAISPTGKSEWSDLWADRDWAWMQHLLKRAIALRDSEAAS